jgi:hypothetical protein
MFQTSENGFLFVDTLCSMRYALCNFLSKKGKEKKNDKGND